MARLARIRIYPIKSLDPMDVSECKVSPAGALVDDRRWAIVDQQGQFVTGKRTPAVHRLRAEFDPDAPAVRLRHGAENAWATFSLSGDREPLESWLSERLGLPVRVEEGPDGGFPDDTEAPGPTVVSTATLMEVASWFPGLSLEEVRRRFRANLEIDDVPAFWEDRLYGPNDECVRFSIGKVVFEGMRPCRRCVVPTRDPETGEAVAGFAAQFARRREATLPEWADRSRFDHFYRLAVNTRLVEGGGRALRVGDEVRLLESD